jgi:hypothetical protein
MNLDEAQRQRVAEWIAQGLKLSEIQNRLAAELGLRLTYMEVRLLVDDLRLTPKDVEPPRSAAPVLPSPAAPPATSQPRPADRPGAAAPEPAPPTGAVGRVSVSVDELARPGAVVSGKVTFSDGNKAEWYMDETGRLGLLTQKAGYRPPASDVQQFQATLHGELSKLGF